MARYELLVLAISELTKDETQTLEATIEKTITAHGASLLSWDRWGKYRLEYAINKKEYGIYFLARFEVEPSKAQALISALNTLCAVKFIDIVIRHMISALPIKGSLEYKRPESLEEAPSRDVSTFFKDSSVEEIVRPDAESMDDHTNA